MFGEESGIPVRLVFFVGDSKVVLEIMVLAVVADVLGGPKKQFTQDVLSCLEGGKQDQFELRVR